jgi:hypothetical protein
MASQSGLLYIVFMESTRGLGRHACFFGIAALLLSGCGGRSINKTTARDAIIGSQAAALATSDLEVLSVSQMGSQAVVETDLHSAFRLEKVGSEWVVREVRVGQGQWEKLDDILRALQRVKVEETRQVLEKIASAIEAYRQKNGQLPQFSDYVGLSDALFPLYMSPIVRLDAWGQPLSASRVDLETVRLASAGPDGKLGTADDIELTRVFGVKLPH